MTEAADSGIAEVARFARGLQADLPAIKAGLTLGQEPGLICKIVAPIPGASPWTPEAVPQPKPWSRKSLRISLVLALTCIKSLPEVWGAASAPIVVPR
jgi:hypothetical protein